METAIVVAEASPGAMPPGHLARYTGVCDWLTGSQFDIEPIFLSDRWEEEKAVRVARVREFATSSHLRSRVSQAPRVVVLGLSSPHMLWLGSRLCEVSDHVWLDVCDSTCLAIGAQIRARRVIGSFSPVAAAMLLRRSGRAEGYLYISPRDLRLDGKLLAEGRGCVVPPPPLPASAMAPVIGPIERVVAPVDVRAFQNRRAFSWFLDFIGSPQWPRLLPVDIYGPVAPERQLPDGARYRGWAPDLEDVYAGQTLIFASNMFVTGIPNKVMEALHFARPIVAHEEVLRAIPEAQMVSTFRSRRSLPQAFYEALRGFDSA